MEFIPAIAGRKDLRDNHLHQIPPSSGLTTRKGFFFDLYLCHSGFRCVGRTRFARSLSTVSTLGFICLPPFCSMNDLR